MSLTRRLAAALPVAGVTAFAALALTGVPAAATGDETARVAHPAVMTTPCAEGERGDDCGYGNEAPAATDEPTRGKPGYGGESPSTTPSTTAPTSSPTPSTPTASVDTVPPGGESPAVSPSVSTAATPSPTASTPGGGVSAGGTLPLTGAPMGATLAVGAALVLAGAGAVFYSRRRRA